MPIRVTCQCGQSLNVPDSMAGKSGKCPKCQKVVRIPDATTTAAAVASKGVAKPAATGKEKKQTPASAPPMSATLAGLFDSAGLVQKSGIFCPSCDQPSRPGAVLCTHCGFNFSEGTQIEGHQVVEKREYGNKNLNDAAKSMIREESTQQRMLSSGTPWWMMFAALTGLVLFVAGALVKMDANQTGEISKIDWMARIQRANWLPVMAASSGTGLLLIAIFAYIALVCIAFFESKKQGFLSLFIPLYLVYYMFSRIRSHKLLSTIAILWVSSILAGVLLGYALPKI